MPKVVDYKPLAEKFAKFCENKSRTVREIHEHIGAETRTHKLVAAAGSMGWAVYYHKASPPYRMCGEYETWRR